MKKLLFLLFIPFVSFGQLIATVDENGKKVVLKKDGTWIYQGQIEKDDYSGTGIWAINYFVDDFGDPTDKGYIAPSYYIKGTFSNSATTNSELNVIIIIQSKSDIAVQLYEYAGDTPVKAYSRDSYNISVKDNSGVKHSMDGVMFEGGNRIYFDPNRKKDYVSKMHELLAQEGEITVVITDKKYGLNRYQFKFNANGYNAAFDKLFGQ